MARVHRGAQRRGLKLLNRQERNYVSTNTHTAKVRGQQGPVTLLSGTTHLPVSVDTRASALKEQIGFMSDPLLIDKDDRCLHGHGRRDSDVNTVNCYLPVVLLFKTASS